MADTYRRIRLEFHPAIARITLNNPPLNIIDDEMIGEVLAALTEIERRPAIMAIVFAGSERAFSAGLDIGALQGEKVESVVRKFHQVIGVLVASRKLTVASVRRHCLGGGAELALMCDLIYCCPDAIFSFPEIKLATIAPAAMVALSAVVGQKRSAELLLTARAVNAQEAHEMGLVNGIAMDPETLVTETLARVQQFSPAALSLAKKAFYAWDAIHFEKGLARAEQIFFDELMKTEDAKEGMRAYAEKRRAKWVGK